MFFGPLLALVRTFDSLDLNETQSIEDASLIIEEAIQLNSMNAERLQNALKLWCRHVQESWPVSEAWDRIVGIADVGNASLRYRLGFQRTDSKNYKNTRQELLSSKRGGFHCS